MSRSLRVLLFAHHQAGMSVLQGLREAGHDIVACFTHPMRRSWIPSVMHGCKDAGIPCREDPLHPAEAGAFREPRPDLIVCAGYRRRVSLPFLALPRWGSINAHLAPLPSYRGASPIPWGILNGESSWAVSIHAMTHNFNEGGILRERIVSVRDTDNAFDLFERCSQLAARAMVETVNDIAAGGGDLVAQDLRAVRFYDTAVPFGGRIDWHQPAERLAAFVRAMDLGRETSDGHYEHLALPAKATLGGQSLGIWRASAGGTMSEFKPGTITRCEGAVWVQTGRGHLVLESIQDENGQDRAAADYLHERGLTAGESFDARHQWQQGESSRMSFAA